MTTHRANKRFHDNVINRTHILIQFWINLMAVCAATMVIFKRIKIIKMIFASGERCPILISLNRLPHNTHLTKQSRSMESAAVIWSMPPYLELLLWCIYVNMNDYYYLIHIFWVRESAPLDLQNEVEETRGAESQESQRKHTNESSTVELEFIISFYYFILRRRWESERREERRVAYIRRNFSLHQSTSD